MLKPCNLNRWNLKIYIFECFIDGWKHHQFGRNISRIYYLYESPYICQENTRLTESEPLLETGFNGNCGWFRCKSGLVLNWWGSYCGQNTTEGSLLISDCLSVQIQCLINDLCQNRRNHNPCLSHFRHSFREVQRYMCS